MWLLALVIACAPAKVVETPTEDPRLTTALNANIALQSERDELAKQIQTVTETAKHPTLAMFSLPFTMPPHWVTDLGLPDTFTVHLRFTASAPVRVRIVSFTQYWEGRNGKTVVPAVAYPATTSLDVDFHETEGCAGYILLWESDGETVVTPNITITYAPADRLTGACIH